MKVSFVRYFKKKNKAIRHGYKFPCDEKGNIDSSSLNETGLKNLQESLAGTNETIDTGVVRIEEPEPTEESDD